MAGIGLVLSAAALLFWYVSPQKEYKGPTVTLRNWTGCTAARCEITSLPDTLPKDWTDPLPLPAGFELEIIPAKGAKLQVRMNQSDEHIYTVDDTNSYYDLDGSVVTSAPYRTTKFEIRAAPGSVGKEYSHTIVALKR